MAKMKVIVTDALGGTQTIENLDPGCSLMELSKQNGVEGVLGNCGGGAACGTCHVYVDEAWLSRLPAPDEIEADMLEILDDTIQANSRLGCQIKLEAALDGLTVTVAPPSDY
ncbi:MAG: (2Fe-2S)-binding protein [Sphingomonadaceae bacterium]|nr:(2Fe-2S)-binding protein [Sphingomonadaceae bacterium]